MSRKPGWLNRNVAGMALASFFSDAGHEAATSVLPLFLSAIGAPPMALGAIEGVADAASSFVKIGAGWISDRLGHRKRIAVSGYALTGLMTGAFALATTWPHILWARLAGWLGRGIRGPVRDAMLSESVPPEARGRAFGFHRAGDTLGAVAGPLLALAVIAWAAGGHATATTYRQIFWITLIPGLMSALAFAVFVRDTAGGSRSGTGLFRTLRKMPRRFQLFLVGVGVFGAGDFAHSLLTLRAMQLLTPSLGTGPAGQAAMVLYLFHNILYAAMAYPVGWLADRVGKRGLLALTYILAAVMGIGWIIAPPSFWFLAVLFALGGTFIAAEDTLEGALAADYLPEEIRGTGYGLLAAVNGLGDFVSSAVVGALWTLVNPAAGFGFATVLFILGAAVIYRLR